METFRDVVIKWLKSRNAWIDSIMKAWDIGTLLDYWQLIK